MNRSSLSPYDETMIHAYVLASLIIRELRNGTVIVHDRLLKTMMQDLDLAVEKHEMEVDKLMRVFPVHS